MPPILHFFFIFIKNEEKMYRPSPFIYVRPFGVKHCVTLCYNVQRCDTCHLSLHFYPCTFFSEFFIKMKGLVNRPQKCKKGVQKMYRRPIYLCKKCNASKTPKNLKSGSLLRLPPIHFFLYIFKKEALSGPYLFCKKM